MIYLILGLTISNTLLILYCLWKQKENNQEIMQELRSKTEETEIATEKIKSILTICLKCEKCMNLNKSFIIIFINK
jgi:cell division protein ZapA (FtsZ GTPase activity inhibitor)